MCTKVTKPEDAFPLKRHSAKCTKLSFFPLFCDRTITCSVAEVFPSADLGLLGGLSMRGSDKRECLPIAFGLVTSLGMVLIPR